MNLVPRVPAIVIDDDVWHRVVTFPTDPQREGERFQSLLIASCHAWAALKPGVTDASFGIYSEPPGSADSLTPLWQPLRLHYNGSELSILMGC